jgi:hypothetical protein
MTCQAFSVGHFAWHRIMASLHSALSINPCKFAASAGMRTGKQPAVSRTVVETLGIRFDDKREEAFAQSE